MKSDLRIQNRDFHSALCEEQFFLVNNKKNSSLTSHSIIHKYRYIQESQLLSKVGIQTCGLDTLRACAPSYLLQTPWISIIFSSLDWCGVLIQFKVVKSLFSLKPKAKPMTVYREHLRNQEPEKLLFNFNAVAQRKRMVLSLLFISIN